LLDGVGIGFGEVACDAEESGAAPVNFVSEVFAEFIEDV
jgi:hypothetical protein